MASKNELLEIIRDNGLNGNASMTKAELQEIVDRLRPSRPEEQEQEEQVENPGEEQVENPEEEQAQPDLNEGENPKEEKTEATDFDELLGKIKGAEAPSPKTPKGEAPIFEKKKRKSKKGESDPNSFRMQGYLLLLATDTIFPAALSFANNMLDKKHKISVAELKLNDRDFASLEPIADQAADYMSININPIAGFFIMASFLYANNIIILKMQP